MSATGVAAAQIKNRRRGNAWSDFVTYPMASNIVRSSSHLNVTSSTTDVRGAVICELTSPGG